MDDQPYVTKSDLAAQVMKLRKQLQTAAVREQGLAEHGEKAMQDATDCVRRQSRVIRVQRWGATAALVLGLAAGWLAGRC